MPQPRKPSFPQFQASARRLLSGLGSPQFQEEAAQQDTDPQNMQQLAQAIQDPRHQNPIAQQALLSEKQRLEQQQAAMVRQKVQQFPQRLAQSLELQQHTGMPSPSPESFMAKLMLQMQRRAQMPRPQLGGPELGPTAQSNSGF